MREYQGQKRKPQTMAYRIVRLTTGARINPADIRENSKNFSERLREDLYVSLWIREFGFIGFNYDPESEIWSNRRLRLILVPAPDETPVMDELRAAIRG